ncbi:hypothetical protein HNQ07_002398 [Deinococcus metalli]|uniref:SARP family transcriptional regulator n=1 Tax=Deinococcus metalli TaxID=1141878 RepID=A0A7W8KI56_9DEIO|nr:hypothetical protein [Deinococcus metalli]MBB5376934.1 hypothetical protein [Deinococcus metalli]GHF46415.1 hypothetical protein GCM10017781_23610 [Deinococcus metalli]
MFRLNLLGHVHLTKDDVVVPLSRKALALITYLTLDAAPHHRDHLAGLLWENAKALLNLRVELTRLRQQGVELFPARQAILDLRLPTDLDQWDAAGAQVQGNDVPTWLAQLHDTPLSGLDDLGSGVFRTWLDHQRDQIVRKVERRSSVTAARLRRQGQAEASAAIYARAAALGLELGTAPPSEPPPATVASNDWPLQTGTFRALLGCALLEPQCVLVWGQHGSARTLVTATAALAGWHAVQLQFTSSEDDLLHAVLRHLIAPLPGAERATLEEAITASTSAQNMMRLATLLSHQPQPVLLALHDLYEMPQWLGRMLSLLMNLRVPLMLVASPTAATALHGAPLAHTDWTRVHQLTLPPLSTASVYAHLRARHPHDQPTVLRSHASQIAQLSEGWVPYVDALLDAPTLTPRVPQNLSTRIRAQYGHLDPGLRRRLSMLAQVQDQFTLPVAVGLLGEDAAATVHAALALGILTHAAPREQLRFPELEGTHDDADSRLVFRSEVERVALAGALSPAERQGVREDLARLLLETRPGMALYYAGRVQDPDLIARAHAALPATRAVSWQRVHPHRVLPPGRDPAVDAERREVWTPNGYRLCAQGGRLDVLRRGASAPPPPLEITLGPVRPGPWSVTLRLDVFRASARVQVSTPPFAVGLQVADGPLQAFAPDVTATAIARTCPPAQYFEGLPVGEDVQLTGRWDGAPGTLTLSFQAVDLACTIHDLRWNGVNLLASTAGTRVGCAAH